MMVVLWRVDWNVDWSWDLLVNWEFNFFVGNMRLVDWNTDFIRCSLLDDIRHFLDNLHRSLVLILVKSLIKAFDGTYLVRGVDCVRDLLFDL
jgi:hypothetical protein